MQPNTPAPEPPSTSMDYLNQISVQTPQKTISPWVLWGIIAGVLILTIGLFIAILSGGTSNADRMTTISAELTSLKTVSDDASEKLQSSTLRTLNSSLSLTLTNLTRDMADATAVLKASSDEKDKRVQAVASEVSELSARLEDARLNAVYDRTYAREIAYYLKTLHSQMSELYAATHSETARSFLQKADEQLSAFTEGFTSYNGS